MMRPIETCPTCGATRKTPVWKLEGEVGEKAFQKVESLLGSGKADGKATDLIALEVRARTGLVFSILAELKRQGKVREILGRTGRTWEKV